MDLITIDKTMLDVIEHPENYEVDVCAAAFGLLKDISRKVYDLQKNVEYRIIMDMEKDEATKLNYINAVGENKVITLKDGPMKQAVDNAEEVIQEAGFDPKQFGDYMFKVMPWGKLKNMRKLGGEIKELIDKLYVRGKKTITIGDR